MTLSLKQARRMVAKSRRRVWRLSRKANIDPTPPQWENPTGYAVYIVEGVLTRRPAVTADAMHLANELRRRTLTLNHLTLQRQDRAWDRYRQSYYGRRPPE